MVVILSMLPELKNKQTNFTLQYERYNLPNRGLLYPMTETQDFVFLSTFRHLFSKFENRLLKPETPTRITENE